MFLHTKLENRKDPIKICFIGCGKFVSMFLAQYNHLDKIQIDTIVDINVDQAKKNCLKSGLNEQTVDDINFSNSLDEVLDRDIEIFIEATGNPIVGTVHAAKIIKNKKHVISASTFTSITSFLFFIIFVAWTVPTIGLPVASIKISISLSITLSNELE